MVVIGGGGDLATDDDDDAGSGVGTEGRVYGGCIHRVSERERERERSKSDV